MVVALAAGHCGAHPGAHRGVDPVDHRRRADLLVHGSPLGVGERVAVEGGGDPVVARGAGQKIAGELADRELVKRQIGVTGLDHPVAIGPDLPRRIGGEAGAIGIAGQIEPLPGLMFAGAFIHQQPLDEPLHCLGARVCHKPINLLRGQRQTGEINRQPAGECGPIGLWLRGQSFGLEPRQHKPIDWRARPVGLPDRRQRRPAWRQIRPMWLVASPRGDPFLEQIDLVWRQRRSRLGGWHHQIRIARSHPLQEHAGYRIARHDRGVAAEIGGGASKRVEPQAICASPLPRLGIGAMAAQAAVGEERLDVAGERGFGHGRPRQRSQHSRQQQAEQSPWPPTAGAAVSGRLGKAVHLGSLLGKHPLRRWAAKKSPTRTRNGRSAESPSIIHPLRVPEKASHQPPRPGSSPVSRLFQAILYDGERVLGCSLAISGAPFYAC